MTALLTEEAQACQQMAHDFAKEELLPFAAKWDKENFFPVDTLKKAANLGLAGIYASEAIGGAGLTRSDAAVIFEALSTGCISTAAYLSIHNMVTAIIDSYGSDDIKKRFGNKLTTMDYLSSYCLTEPGSGSDAAALKTTAKKEGDYYLVNGAKAFISGGGVSDIYVCMVRTGDESYKGISCLLIEKGTKGLSFGKKEEKLGWHSQPTTMVFFENVKVPVQNLIGEEGRGFNIALNALNGGRINIAACSLGGAKASLNIAKQYMHERKQFKKPLHAFQALRFKFADMYTDFIAARHMVYTAAIALDNNTPDTPLQCAMAKRFATDKAFTIANNALQILGGYGYLNEYPLERIMRDLRVHQILEGTNEIMREIIAKNCLQEDFYIA